jgi:hypothetical protein
MQTKTSSYITRKLHTESAVEQESEMETVAERDRDVFEMKG